MVSRLAPDVIQALADYLRAWRRAARLGREPEPVAGAVEVQPDQVWWRRLAVTGAVERLPAGRYAAAAFGGLQDSDPRAGLLSLHARVDEVGPEAWEHPTLAQVWLRWSDYIVPRADTAVFTVGARPRDQRFADAVDRLTDVVLTRLVDGRCNSRAIAGSLPELANPTWIRASGVSGRVLIRWDTRTTTVVEMPLAAVDPDGARRELACRFLHWHGPAGPGHFAKWAGVTREDAEATWRSLADEIVPIAVGGRGRWLLRSDLDALVDIERPHGVRLLPANDPCLHLADIRHGERTQPPPSRRPDPAAGVTQRVLNSLTGRVLVDGAIVGAWGRAGNKVTIDPWPALPHDRVDDVAAAAEALAGPIGQPIRLRWL